MLIGSEGPQIMPVPQAVMVIGGSQTPMMQVQPAAFQQVPYFPSSTIPTANSIPLEFTPVNLPQLLISQPQSVIRSTAGAAAPTPMSIKFSTGASDKPVQFDMQIGQQKNQPAALVSPQVAVPYMVSSRSGGMVATSALQGLEDGKDALILLGILAVGYLIFRKRR